MNKAFVAGIIGLIIGILLTNFSNIYKDKIDSAKTNSSHEMTSHNTLSIDTNLPIPEVSIEAFADKMDGYNIHIITPNYIFTPEKVNQEPNQGEGHAHIYVNDVKVARVYSEWFHLSSSKLQEGENKVKVTLNANDHSEWTINDNHIEDEIVIIK